MEETALYRPLIRRAWQITSRFKKFWLLGLFAAIIGSSGEYEILSRLFYQPTSLDINTNIVGSIITSFQDGIDDGGGNLLDGLWAMITVDPANLFLIAFILLITVSIVTFLIWLAIVGQAGLIRSIDEADRGKMIAINEAIDSAVRQFWPIAAINIIMKLAILLLFTIISLTLIVLYPLGTYGLVAYYVLFVIFILAVFIISLILKYQLYYVILEDQSLSAALKSAWSLYKRNWLISLETSVLLFSVYIIVTFFTLLIGVFLLAVPLVLAQYYNLPTIIPALVILLSIVAIIILSLVIGSIVMTFQWSVWTLLFRRINASPEDSKIVRAVNALPTYLTGLVRK